MAGQNALLFWMRTVSQNQDKHSDYLMIIFFIFISVGQNFFNLMNVGVRIILDIYTHTHTDAQTKRQIGMKNTKN